MSKISNKRRAEVTLELGGKKYTAKLTLNAIEKIEAEIDNNIFVTISRLGNNNLSFSDIVTILTIAISETNSSITREQIGEALLSDGLGKSLEMLVKIFNPILGNKDEASENEGNE